MSELNLLYRIREALGFNQYYPLSDLADDAKAQRRALLACAPLAFATIAEEQKDTVGNSDLDDEQPVVLAVRTTLGVVREARRALLLAGIRPGERAGRTCELSSELDAELERELQEAPKSLLRE